MTKKNSNVDLVQQLLDLISIDPNIPKKISMKYITDKLKDINKDKKEDKKINKKEKKLTAYNIFVREQMILVKNSHPNMNNNERMTYIGKLWKENKEKDNIPKKRTKKNDINNT